MRTEAENTVHVFIGIYLKTNVRSALPRNYATCTAARKAALDATPMTEQELNGRPRFNLTASHRLYKSQTELLESMLASSRRIYATALGELGDLSLAMLSA